ncbi:MAG: hypothetical protein R6X34_24535 [Chloroflexota bacterium]
MSDRMAQKIKTAVAVWVREQFKTSDVVSYLFPDEDEAERYIVVFAVSGLDGWRAAEVWVENEAVVSVNDVGEGAPPDEAPWPWD